MENYFKDKVVVITGGTDGIGKALVSELLKLGAKIATCGRSQDKMYGLLKEFSNQRLHGFVADVSNEGDCKRFIESTINEFGGIDILINNAGVSMHALFRDAEPEVFKKVMDINFFGSLYCTKYALESIIKRKGQIIGVSSIAGYRGLPGRSGYSASKFALQGWLEALRVEMLPYKVNVMWVCPGFTTSNIRNTALNEKGEKMTESWMDESKMMSAEECAHHIIKAIAKSKRTLVLTFTGKRTVFMNKYFPSLTDNMVFNFFFKNGKLVN